MQIGWGVGIVLLSGMAWAQAPVEERALPSAPVLQHQQRAEYARSEREKAEVIAAQAQGAANEAQRVQDDAEKRLHQARQQSVKAQQALDRAQAALRQAQAAEAQALHGGK